MVIKFACKHNITSHFLNHIKKQHDVNVIGFYIVKRVRRWTLKDISANTKTIQIKIKKYNVMRKQMTKDKAKPVENEGVMTNILFLTVKNLDVENFDMSNVQVKKGTASELKRMFGKSMANRLVSRVVLNKFIQEVA